MAVYTHVSANMLDSFLAEYAVGEARSFKGIAEGIENSNYLLQTTQAKFILTLYEKRADPENLPYYLNIMELLANAGLDCPLPIADKKGESLKTLAGKPACMISFLTGVSTDNPTPIQCENVGRVLAEMHTVLADHSARVKNPLSLDTWIDMFKGLEDKSDRIEQGTKDKINCELDYLKANWPDNLPTGTIHADLFPDNVLFTDDTVTGIIDFYFACHDMLAYDLAICITAWAFDEEHTFIPANAKALIKGYDAVKSLTKAEHMALPILCRGASIRFFLTRLHDWFVDTSGAVVKKKNPIDYIKRLDQFQTLESFNE